MTHEERIKVYDEATKLWGLVAQYDQCIEEMAELTVAINKYKRKVLYKEYASNPEIEKNLIEEIADASMCLEQMRYFVGEEKVEKVLEEKMQKFVGQIESMKNNKRS